MNYEIYTLSAIAGAIRSKVGKLKQDYGTVITAKVRTGATTDTYVDTDKIEETDEPPEWIQEQVGRLPARQKLQLLVSMISDMDDTNMEELGKVPSFI